MFSATSVIGSIVGTRNDLADVFALYAAGRTRVIGEDRRLVETDDSIEELRAGRTPGRVVLQF